MPERAFSQPPRASLAPSTFASGAASRDALRLFALQDVILLGYLAVVMVALVATSRGHQIATEVCVRRVCFDAALLSIGAFVARRAGVTARVGGVVYRACLVGVLVDSYLMLRDLLPLVRSDTVDAQLHALDVRLFGVEPSLWLERFNRPDVIEWFAFFYFSYFAIAFAYMTFGIWVRRADRATTELAIGVLLVFCIGQLGYLAVPGFGPVRHLAEQFHGPVRGGFFWSCVEHTVAAGGANKDVFPSLHTAAPTFFTLFAARRAFETKHWGWRIAALVTGFFAANIIVSTMLLRWHYAIDVVAGLALATFAAAFAPRLARAEVRLRTKLALRSPWAFG